MGRTRTVVVGAGAIGLACAWALARRGRHVTVLDAGAPGAGCTLGNAGWVVPALAAPIPAPGLVRKSLRWMLSRDSPLYIAPTAVPSLARWLWRFWGHCNAADHQAGLHAVAALNRGTLAAFDALAGEGVDVELHRDGLLYVFLDPRYMDASHEEVRALEPYGYALPEPLDGAALRALEPGLSDEVTSGFLLPGEAHVRPETLATGYAVALQRLGGEVRDGVTVRGGREHGASVVLDTSAGPVEADEVLVAAGARSGEVLDGFGVRLPVQAGKGYSVTIPGAESVLRRPILMGESKVAVTPFDGALRVAGTMELSGVNERFDARRMAAIRRGVARYVRAPLPAGGTEWVGMRPLTPDGLPLLGRVPRLARVWVATGHAMLGITMAPVTGQAMAALMTGGTPPAPLEPFAPGRFRW